MAAVFLRTARALAGDGFGRDAAKLALASLILIAWSAWLVLARVPVYEVSERARLEVDRAVHPVEAQVAGRLVASHMKLGAEVRTGDVLAEIDAEGQRLDLAEQTSRLRALTPELTALEREVAAEEQALAAARAAGAAGVDEASARRGEAEASLDQAVDEESRLGRLHREGQVSDVVLNRARADVQRLRAAAESARLAISRGAGEHTTDASDRIARIERLRGEIARLEGQEGTARAAIERLEHAVGHRLIRASADGTLAEVADLGTGAVISEGDKLGAIVPAGNLRAVADFSPPAAIGRIRPGQAARLRLDGFTWTQYGTVAATVTAVSSEARDGWVRVEFVLLPEADSPIPLSHGLPGAVEVEVERTAPAALVLRAAGKLIASRGRGPRTAN